MKITRRKLRQLIIEAMFDPRAATEKAKSKVPEDMMKNINALIGSDDEMNQTMGYDLLDTLGDYDSPTGTGSSYQDLKDFDQEMTDAAYDGIEYERNRLKQIPGLKKFEQAEAEREQRHRRRRASRNKPFINYYDKFVNTLLHPSGIDLWLSLSFIPASAHDPTDYKNKLDELYRDIKDNPVLPDYLFTDPMWKGYISIGRHGFKPKINNDKSLVIEDEYDWSYIRRQLYKSSPPGLSITIIEFEILRFIHEFVEHTVKGMN